VTRLKDHGYHAFAASPIERRHNAAALQLCYNAPTRHLRQIGNHQSVYQSDHHLTQLVSIRCQGNADEMFVSPQRSKIKIIDLESVPLWHHSG